MRKAGELFYILGDHLGSTSIVTNANGTKVSEMRYKAWGEIRYESGASPTDYTYTGQYSYTADFGLMFYNARWYDPYLNHFTQPDSIVPDPHNPLDWNRYSYVRYNPLKYTDPTGHVACEGNRKDDGPQCIYYKNGGPKTLDDFKHLSWQQRKDWLQIFVEKNNLGNWFNDIEGAIDFMSNDSSMSREGSPAEVMDAAVLQAINDGWRIHMRQDEIGGGGDGWAYFFDLYSPLDGSPSIATQEEFNIARLQAEQYGVDYSYGLSDVQNAISNSSTFDQIYFGEFKYWADTYRTTGISGSIICPLCAGKVDPRITGPVLVTASHGLKPFALMKYSWLVSISPFGGP